MSGFRKTLASLGRMVVTRGLLLAACVLTGAGAAVSQEVNDCDTWQANARNVDWNEPTRTFGEGAIRLIALDTAEPAAAAFHVMVTYPDVEELFLECRLISARDGLGYAGLSLANARAKYDASRGLTVTIPGTAMEGDAVLIKFTINRATGQVTVP